MKIIIDDIKIPEYFSPPNDEKYREKEHTYIQNGYLSPIIIDHNNMLVDGYISYLILKRSGLKEAECVFFEDDEMAIYMKGTHLNGKKEYVWMVPRRLIKAFKNRIKPGDRVFCYSNKRVAPVIVKSVFAAPKSGKVSQVAGY